jgi:hypothetical protein
MVNSLQIDFFYPVVNGLTLIQVSSQPVFA